ncbi:hypothetical protein NEDG_00581 [Nematocida displodere]|uniref:Uncharacterized protein n=1 Tax=Nematocida displodere TaxID=1805483 RepID=A0A177EC98_9MICR|nr:hypothetical protein NEDG_00581 [Nematocida displodere]
MRFGIGLGLGPFILKGVLGAGFPLDVLCGDIVGFESGKRPFSPIQGNMEVVEHPAAMGTSRGVKKRRVSTEDSEPGQSSGLSSFSGTDSVGDTIAFFEGCDSSNTIQAVLSPTARIIIKRQPSKIKIHLSQLTESSIPDKIEPGIEFGKIKIFGPSSSKNNVFSSEESKTLTKLFCVLSTMSIERLCIGDFDLVGEPPVPAIRLIFLSVTQRLHLKNVSSFFLEWFSGRIDLSRCSESFSLTLSRCSATSVRCLDALGIRKLSALCFMDMPRLEYLDCELIHECCSNEELMLWYISTDLKVPTNIAQAIAEKEWVSIRVDLHVWWAICASLQEDVVVGCTLQLNVLDWTEFQDTHAHHGILTRAKYLVIEDNNDNGVVFKCYVVFMLNWAKANMADLIGIEVLTNPDTTTDPALERLWTSIPVHQDDFFNMKKFKINEHVVQSIRVKAH